MEAVWGFGTQRGGCLGSRAGWWRAGGQHEGCTGVWVFMCRLSRGQASGRGHAVVQRSTWRPHAGLGLLCPLASWGSTGEPAQAVRSALITVAVGMSFSACGHPGGGSFGLGGPRCPRLCSGGRGTEAWRRRGGPGASLQLREGPAAVTAAHTCTGRPRSPRPRSPPPCRRLTPSCCRPCSPRPASARWLCPRTASWTVAAERRPRPSGCAALVSRSRSASA